VAEGRAVGPVGEWDAVGAEGSFPFPVRSHDIAELVDLVVMIGAATEGHRAALLSVDAHEWVGGVWDDRFGGVLVHALMSCWVVGVVAAGGEPIVGLGCGRDVVGDVGGTGVLIGLGICSPCGARSNGIGCGVAGGKFLHKGCSGNLSGRGGWGCREWTRWSGALGRGHCERWEQAEDCEGNETDEGEGEWSLEHGSTPEGMACWTRDVRRLESAERLHEFHPNHGWAKSDVRNRMLRKSHIGVALRLRIGYNVGTSLGVAAVETGVFRLGRGAGLPITLTDFFWIGPVMSTSRLSSMSVCCREPDWLWGGGFVFSGWVVQCRPGWLVGIVSIGWIVCAAMCAPALGGEGLGLSRGGVDGSTAVVAGPPKFELDIQPILTATGCNAGGCHGKSRGQNGFALSLLGFDDDFDFAAIVQESRGRRVFPADPAFSLLLQKAAGQVPHGGGVRLPADGEAYATVRAWIESGMPRVDAADPVFEGLEVSGPTETLSAGQAVPLRVWAKYSDGTVRDVSLTSFFQSSDPTVMSVSETGIVRAGELSGDATIMARYRGQIATWQAVIPSQNRLAVEQFANLPRFNFIDDLVWQKLERLNILPSELIDDARFLRRVSVDLIGRLPTAEETRQFLDDSRPDKRLWWVDRLLERPEYADFWANKWADLLRPNPYRVGIKATQSLDVWLRDVFRENRPYDQWVRELLTAQGSTWRNGATVIFRDRRTPDEMTTLVSQLFLGVRLECAKCHQHPFEVYGQGDFYSLAAYFARVGYKGVGLSPPISGSEEMILVSERGSVTHPITGQVLEPKPLWALRSGSVEVEERGPMDAFPEDPREALVDWMVAADNDGFAEAAVNRIWGELFGRGIVDPVDDIRVTNPASHPDLLRALGVEFRRLGYDQKALLRAITASAVYQLSSMPNETNVGDHRNFSRHYRRLSRAEVIADALADVTGVADHWPGLAAGARAMQLWTFRSDSELLDVFGRPDPNQDPPCERLPEATMTQALHLMNTQAIQSKLTAETALPSRLLTAGLEPPALLETMYLTVYNRRPTATERERLLPLLTSAEGAELKAVVENLLWAMLNAPEFIYED